MLQKLKLLFHTLKYLRLRQLYYQVYYRVKNRFFRRSYTQNAPEIATLIWESPIRSENSWTKDDSFTFLNLERSFESIDWNYPGYGKLWTYNLTYFDFLNQEGISQEEGLRLIRDFIQKERTLKDALEPYPISLRGMNWIKFLIKIQDSGSKDKYVLVQSLSKALCQYRIPFNGESFIGKWLFPSLCRRSILKMKNSKSGLPKF